MASKIREKNACKGIEFTGESHKEFDVTTMPFQNLHKDHSVRVAWQEANKGKDWSDKDNPGRDGIEMRPASKDLAGHARADSLSYSKLVRATAVQVHKDDGVDNPVEAVNAMNGRVFQNLVAVIGVDDKTFVEAAEAVSKVVNMFMADVEAEVPEAKPSAGGGKTKAEVRAEVEAEIEEKLAALRAEAVAYVQRAATKQGLAGVPFPTGVSMDMLGEAYAEVKAKFESDKSKEAKEALQTLEAWAAPFQSLWVATPIEEHDTLSQAAD